MNDKKKSPENNEAIISSESEALNPSDKRSKNTVTFAAPPEDKSKQSSFESLRKEAEAAFSVESLTEKAGDKKFAVAFNELLSFQDDYHSKDEKNAINKLEKAAGKSYSGKVDKHPYLLFGHALLALFTNTMSSSWMIEYIIELAQNNINVNLFFALPAVVKKIEYKSKQYDANYTGILAMLTISQYGVDYDKAKLAELAERLDYSFRNGGRDKYMMTVTPERLRDIANGLYDTVFKDIRKFRTLAISAENAGQIENAAGYYLEAAKLADLTSIRDYLRLSTDLNRDIANVTCNSKDYKLYEKCLISARKKKNISEQIAALQPAMDIYFPGAYRVASNYYEKAGDEENTALMNEKAISLAEEYAITNEFKFENAELFAADTDRYMRFAFLRIANVVRRGGKLIDGFNISINNYYLNKFYEMLLKLCATHDFFDENEENVPQLDDGQKRIIFAWVFKGSFDKRFNMYDQNTLANLFNIGFGTPINKPAAIAIWSYEIANNQSENNSNKSDMAAYFLGRAYLLGDGVERDKEKAVEYLNKVTSRGEYANRAKRLLELCDKTPNGLSDEGVYCYQRGEYEKALGYFETAALLGSAIGCRNAGACYYIGQGTQKNTKKAYEFFRIGADGDIQCAFNAGVECDDNGDYTSARVYYERASAMKDVGNGHVDGKAALNLALLYYNGKLTGKKDNLRYLFWMKKAIASGFAVSDQSKKTFADTTATSYEILMAFNAVKLKQPTDEFSAFVLEKAVEENILGAREELGVRYYTGNGASVDKSKAFYLLTRAKAETHTDKCEYYLACWYADNAIQFYLDSDIKSFYDSTQKADGLIYEIEESIDYENKRDLISTLVEYSDFMIALNAYEDNEVDGNEVEESFERTEALLLSLEDEYSEMALGMLTDINMLTAVNCEYLDEDDSRERLKASYRYMYKGVSSGLKHSEKVLASTKNDHIITAAQMFDADEPEIALFYLNMINETNVDAMRKTGGIYKLVYNDYQRALYYFDKALRAGSDDAGVFTEIGLMVFDRNGNYQPSEYGISKAQQKEYLKMSAANGCKEAQKVLSILKSADVI